MTFNSVLVVSVAAQVWRQMASLAEHIGGQRPLGLVSSVPLRRLGRWALGMLTYLCVIPSPVPHGLHRHATYRYYGEDFDYSGESGGVGDASSTSYTRFLILQSQLS